MKYILSELNYYIWKKEFFSFFSQRISCKTFHAVSMTAFLITNILVMLSAVGKIMSEAHYVPLESLANDK